jgi:universal stress protein E
MLKLRRILVPVRDLDLRSRAAIDKAAQLARHGGATVELFHAFDMPLDPYVAAERGDIGSLERSAHARARTRLEKVAKRLRATGVTVETTVVSDYPAYEAVIRRATQTKAGLIVADAHHRHIAATLLGLTDWELLRHAPTPVLLVKSTRAWRSPVVLAAVDPQNAYDKPARLDRAILKAGAVICDSLGGELHAMHAYAPLPEGFPGVQAVVPSMVAQLHGLAETSARKAFERALKSSGLPPRRRHLLPQYPADAIASTARRLGASIVVMGAVARPALKRLLVGSTAERVLDRLTCDVLIIKPSGTASGVASRRRGVRWMAPLGLSFT